MAKTDKLLNQYKSGYRKALTLLKENGNDVEAARKISNLRAQVARKTEVKTFEESLRFDETFSNLPLDILVNVDDIIKGIINVKEAVRNAAASVAFDTDHFTTSEFLEALRWFEHCNDMRTWVELENINEAFTLLKNLAIYYNLAVVYVEDWAAQIQKQIWDGSGFYYDCEHTQITVNEDGDAPYDVRELWQQAYRDLAIHAYEIHSRMTSHTQVFDVPKYLIEDGRYYLTHK